MSDLASLAFLPEDIALAVLAAIDAIPPTAQVIELRNVMRDDEPRPSLPVEEILANAPYREDDRFQVQAILE